MTTSASGKARRIRFRRPWLRAGVVDQADSHRANLDRRRRRQALGDPRLVDVAVDRAHRRAERGDLLEGRTGG